MKTLRPLLLAAALAVAGAAGAQSAAPSADLAQQLTAISLAQDVEAADPRVAETQKLLDKAVKLTREEAFAVASACRRYVGHLRDSAQIRATPLELLAALAAHGKAGVPMNDTLQAYVAARKAAPGRTHGEAMAALGGRR